MSFNCKLFNDDCLTTLPTIEEKSVDLILADLPYSVTACVWDCLIPMDKLWEQYKRILKPSGIVILTASQPFTTKLINSNLDWFRYEWIWEKPQGTNPMNVHVMPLKSHENILVFYEAKGTYNPQMWYDKPYSGFKSKTAKLGEVYGENSISKHRDNSDGSRFPKTVLKFGQEKGLHPTQKPVALMEYMIKTYSNADELVLDNTMGSGTTGVACKKCGRNFIGIEKDKTYFDIAINRIEEYTDGELIINQTNIFDWQ